MKRWQIFLISIFFTVSFSWLYIPSGRVMSATAPLFTGMGNHHHPINTKSPQAQKYFDQGLVLAYGFNHAEAARSFRQAIKLDPNCAMCHWGLAYVLGSNINVPMDDNAIPESYRAIQQASKLAQNTNSVEQAYIEALGQRYTDQVLEDRSSLDLAYAEGMAKVVEQFPQDLDAATLYAEALMNTMPWDYWTANGEPKPETKKVLTTLETILAKEPNHPGANHLYIHAVEAVQPEKGIPAADRLRDLVPGSGHLVHMPSHIYIRVGRYHEAAVANQKAIAADDNYFSQCHAQGIYPVVYQPHNHHFLWFAAVMEGDLNLATEAGNNIAGMVDSEMMRQPGMGILQHFASVPLFTMIRFGQWQPILAAPAPAADLKYPTGIWHYARGLAYATQGNIDLARQELAPLALLAQDPELAEITILDINTTQDILQVATEVLRGEIALREGKNKQAIARLRQAVSLEDALNYDEPADWSIPVRQYLGAALLTANRPQAAEEVYREDLAVYPRNGWSLFGLTQSLQAQNKDSEAQQAQKQFASAWKDADVKLTSSKF